MRCNRHRVEPASADDVDLSRQHGDPDRGARRFHGRERAPAVVRGIVFEHDVARPLVHRGGEAAEGIDFAVVRGDAEMIARLRQRRALPPAVARGVVFLVARHRFASNPAAEREELVADCRGRDLAAHGRHRRFLRPSSGRRLRLRDGAERGDH